MGEVAERSEDGEGSTAFRIVGTMDTEEKPASETVGNGLCAVPHV